MLGHFSRSRSRLLFTRYYQSKCLLSLLLFFCSLRKCRHVRLREEVYSVQLWAYYRGFSRMSAVDWVIKNQLYIFFQIRGIPAMIVYVEDITCLRHIPAILHVGEYQRFLSNCNSRLKLLFTSHNTPSISSSPPRHASTFPGQLPPCPACGSR